MRVSSENRSSLWNGERRILRSIVTRIPEEHGIPLVQIGNRIDEVNDLLLPVVRRRLEEDFAVRVSGLDVSDIELDRSSEGYRLLMNVTRDPTRAVVASTRAPWSQTCSSAAPSAGAPRPSSEARCRAGERPRPNPP